MSINNSAAKVILFKYSRSTCRVTIWDRISNEEIRRRVGVLSDLSGRVEKGALRWFGHVERMDGEMDI